MQTEVISLLAKELAKLDYEKRLEVIEKLLSDLNGYMMTEKTRQVKTSYIA